MDRRDFLGAMAAAPLTGAYAAQGAASKAPGCYVVQHYRLQLGTQGSRLSEYMSKAYLPAVARANGGPTLVLEAQFSEQLPLVTIIDAFPSVAQAMNLRATLQADKALQDATDAWQTGPERPFESLSAELLETTAFSPAFAPPNPPPKAPRVYRCASTRRTRRRNCGASWNGSPKPRPRFSNGPGRTR